MATQGKARKLTKSDYEELTQTFLKEARAGESQEALSLQLEASFNIVNRWENGSRKFYWNDFLALAAVKKWDVPKAMLDVFHIECLKPPESHQVAQILSVPSARQILKPDFSTQKINRLSAGKSKLLFSEFLFMTEVVFGRAQRFLGQFMDVPHTPSLKKFFTAHDTAVDAMNDMPQLAALRLLMSLKQYLDHEEDSVTLFSRILKVPEKQVSRVLAELSERGVLTKSGRHYKTTDAYVDTGATDRNYSRKMANHFREQITKIAKTPEDFPGDLLSSYILYPTHPELEEKVFELCRQFYIDLKNMVAQYEGHPHENIRYIGIDLFYPFGSKDPFKNS